MNNKLIKKLALGLALVVTVTSLPVTANAAKAPGFKTQKATVKVGMTKKYTTVNTGKKGDSKAKRYSVSFEIGNESLATIKYSKGSKSVKITGVKAGETVLTANFKNYKTKKVTTATLPVTVKDTTVTKAAKDYFANYVDRKKQPADVFKLIEENANIVIIDIRDAESYKAEHLKGAINIPYKNIAEYLDIIPNDVPVYVNCFSGQTASQTVALLAVAGKDAYNIQGGWNNGISADTNYKNYVETTVNPLPTKKYPVNAYVQEAITKYYEDAAASASGNFNFQATDLAKLIEAGDDTYTVVDIRSAADYAAGHIEVVELNIPFATDAMPADFDKIPMDKPVIIQCTSGQTASQTIAILRLLGYEAYNLSGGMKNGWLKSELPVVK